MSVESFSVTLGLPALAKVHDLMKKLIRAGERRGVDITYHVGPATTGTRPYKEHQDNVRYMRKGYALKAESFLPYSLQWERTEHEVTVSMPPLSDKWQVIATLEPADPSLPQRGHNSPAIVNYNPTITGEDWGEMPFIDHCHHCESGRRGRHKTIIVKSKETGESKTVGSSCMWEYTSIDPAMIESMIEVKDMMLESNGGGAVRDPEVMPLEEYALRIAHWAAGTGTYQRGLGRALYHATHFSIPVSDRPSHGQVGIPTSGNTGVSGPVIGGFMPLDSYPWSKFPIENLKPTEQTLKLATLFIDHVKAIEPVDGFTRNVKTAVDSGIITPKTAAYVGGCASRWVKTVREAPAPEDETVDAGHWQTVGSRWSGSTVVTITSSRTFEGAYGMTTLLSMTTPEGHVLKWFRSGERPETIGKQYTLLGAFVKKHSDFKGRNETMVNRLKWVVV